MRCPSCGTELHDLQIFCPKCGARPVAKSETTIFQRFAKPETPNPIQTKPPVTPLPDLEQIVGQTNVIRRLLTIAEFLCSRGDPAEHLLLTGPDGMGKRTIGHAFAGTCRVGVKELDATTIERKGDLTAVLTSLETRQVLLMQNIGSLRSNIREILISALQRYQIDLVIGLGSGARRHPFQLNRFTCIATANREADCPPELREAFALAIPIESYSQSELEALAALIASKVGVSMYKGVAKMIVGSCGGIPHQLEIMVQRLAKLSSGIITEENALEVLSTYGINISATRLPTPIGDLQNLTGIQFEELITSLLARLGFHAQMTKASGDGGIDIVAVLDKPVIGGKYLFQCKRFASSTLIGAPIVREFYGAVSADRKAVKGTLVTTSGFTDQARDFAQEVGIELIDMVQLSRLLTEQGMRGADPQKAEPLFPRDPPPIKNKDLF